MKQNKKNQNEDVKGSSSNFFYQKWTFHYLD